MQSLRGDQVGRGEQDGRLARFREYVYIHLMLIWPALPAPSVPTALSV